MIFSGFSKRTTIIISVCLALAILLLALNPLVSRIVGRMTEKKLEQKLGAKIELASLKLNLFTGRAVAKGFQLAYTQSNGNRLLVKSQLLDTKLKLLPIFTADKVDIPWVTLRKPQISYERKAKGEARGIIDRSKQIFDLWRKKRRKKKEAKSNPKKKYDIIIGKIDIDQGRFDWIDHTVAEFPLTTTYDELTFKSSGFSSRAPLRFLMNSEYTGVVIASGEKATLYSKRTFDPEVKTQRSVTEIYGVNIAHFAPYFGMSGSRETPNPILLKGGRLDYRRSSYLSQQPWKMTLDYNLELTGLNLSLNKDAEKNTFFFIPVRKLVEYVEEKEGKLSFSFHLELGFDELEGEISDVLEDFLLAAFAGAMREAAKQMGVKIEEKIGDTALAAESKTALVKSRDIMARYIDVDVLEGVVTLIGAVKSASAKTTTTEIVSQIDGVREVKNLLRVYPNLGQKAENIGARQRIRDAGITGKVRTTLALHQELKSLNVINVDTQDGVVVLVAKVRSDAEKQRALSIVHELKGVREVVDLITVVSSRE